MCHYKHLTPFERERILFFLGRLYNEVEQLIKK